MLIRFFLIFERKWRGVRVWWTFFSAQWYKHPYFFLQKYHCSITVLILTRFLFSFYCSLFTFLWTSCEITLKLLLIAVLFCIITLFLFLFCEWDTPALLLEMWNQAATVIFFLFRIIVKPVMLNNLHFLILYSFSNFYCFLIFSSFTITAISCEV